MAEFGRIGNLLFVADAAARDALGSGEVAVGDGVYVIADGEIDRCESVGVPSTFSRKREHVVHCVSATPGTNLERYMNWVDTAIRSNLNIGNGATAIAAHDGQVKKVVCHMQNDPGSTDVKFYKSRDTGTVVDSDTQVPSGADVSTQYDFTSATFNAGDEISLGEKPTNDPGIITWTITLEYDELTGV